MSENTTATVKKRLGKPVVRPMTLADVPAVWAIQLRAYADPKLHESKDHYERKLAGYPQGCWVAEAPLLDDAREGEPGDDTAEKVVVGYLIAYPSMLDDPPALSYSAWEVPAAPDAFFIHEVTVDPCRQGMGLGRILSTKAAECARTSGVDARYVALISVQGSSRFWNQQGGYLPYDFDRNCLLTRLPGSRSEENVHQSDEGPRLYDENTSLKLKDKLQESYGAEALMMLAPMPE